MSNLTLADVAPGLAEAHANMPPPMSQKGYHGTLGYQLDKGESTLANVSLVGDGYVRAHYSDQGGGSPSVTAGMSSKTHKPYKENEYKYPVAGLWNILRIDRRSRVLGGRINGARLSAANLGGYMTEYEAEWMYRVGVQAQSDGTNIYGWCDPGVVNATGTGGVVTMYNLASTYHFNLGDIVCVIPGGATQALALSGKAPGTPSAPRPTNIASDEGGLEVVGRNVSRRTITLARLDGTAITDLNIAVPTFAEGDHIGFLGAYSTVSEQSQGIVGNSLIGLGGYLFQFHDQAQATQYGVDGSTNPDLFGLREHIESSISPEQLSSLLRRVVQRLPRMDDLGISRDWDATLYYPLEMEVRVGQAFEGRTRLERRVDDKMEVAQYRTGFDGWIVDIGSHRIRLVGDSQMSDPWSRVDEDVVSRLVPDGLCAMPNETANGGNGRPSWDTSDGSVLRYETATSEVKIARFGVDAQIIVSRPSAGVTFTPNEDITIP